MTGDQGYVDDERSCFWTWDDTEGVWQSNPHKGRQLKRRKGRSRSKVTGRAFYGQEQAQDLELWSEEDLAWWSKGKQSKKDFSKSSAVRKKAQARISHRTRAEERTKKGKSKEGVHPHSGLSASETPSAQGYGHAWESDDMVCQPLA